MAAPRGRQQQDPDPDPGPVYVDEHHQAFSEFADSYLDEDERESFVEHLMERHGYQRVNSWGPRQDPEPDPVLPAGIPLPPHIAALGRHSTSSSR